MLKSLQSSSQILELLKKKKKRGNFYGGPGACSPRNFWKSRLKICATWGILEVNLKKYSTLKFIMNISFVPSMCIHRSIILIFIQKKYPCRFFYPRKIFFRDFRFSFPQKSLFLRRIPGSVLWASGRVDFSLGVNIGSDFIPPKPLLDESIKQGLVCAHMHSTAKTQKFLTFMS